MERIYTIMLDNGASYQARGDESLEIRRGDMCVVSREFFYDCGRVSAPGALLEEDRARHGERSALRPARRVAQV